ncbi:hypothetical protein H4S02_000475 [Coemansia sp. RSA 2611]|nr:hypothetical protein IWW52_001148 [Coemansia sp. RSA 2704]KAJ2370230.1 hypothetical protein H4S01_000510 [Coemansia sp. RSA 2610]KAJ2392986.1 hypothetical protein H4S02_000475 [Coemansia sp. RSA 2611]KAJ2739093.1 hypothetical protein H4R23_000703 [Coemansia sp. Cherry 401B]
MDRRRLLLDPGSGVRRPGDSSPLHIRGSRRTRNPPEPAPRLLVRPSALPTAAPTPTPTAPAVAPVPRPAAPSPAPADPRHTRVPLISAQGKLQGARVRSQLGPLSVRHCVGVIGRAGTGKSTLLSRLAQHPQHASATRCVDAWVTRARVVLVDAPPVLCARAADKWRFGDSRPPSRVATRVHSLQLALWLLQVCDELLVVVDWQGTCRIDRGVARLLRLACGLVDKIPGLTMPDLPGRDGSSGGCRLHVVARCDDHSDAVRGQVARQYEDATGIRVARVTLLPYTRPPEVQSAADTICLWADRRPLYATGQQPGLVAADPDLLGAPTYDQCVEDLCDHVLAPACPGGASGAWASLCLRSWDSIRRSDQLQALAAVHDPDLDSTPRERRWGTKDPKS